MAMKLVSPVVDGSPESQRLRVLCLVDYFLPGFRGGGPARTIVNMVEQLGDEFEFLIYTRDRDFKSPRAYEGVQVDSWGPFGRARIYYASPAAFSFSGLRRLLTETPHAVLYLNSFFSPRATILPLLIRRMELCRVRPTLLAPRGEFSAGALALKGRKKRLYLLLSRRIGLFRGVAWQASSALEACDIQRVVNAAGDDVFVAPNPLAHYRSGAPSVMQDRPAGPLRVIFVSRISPKKNLDYLLDALSGSSEAVDLTIYGPKEDPEYWESCHRRLVSLPQQVRARYCGEWSPEQVNRTFAASDVFVFPTKGENFGHVILESLSAGTCVVVSDQTPWRPDAAGALEVLPLDQVSDWTRAIERWARLAGPQLQERRRAALAYAAEYRTQDESVELNRQMFLRVAERP
jgi:glycosyltransferase involved in cell wall biosynthesis